MITMTVQYEDLNGDTQTAELYFHLYKHQALELLEGEGGLKQQLQNLLTTEDGGVAYQAFKALIQASYGFKTADGKFDRDEDATRSFMNGPELDALIDRLEADEQTALDFVTGIFPKGMLTADSLKEAAASKGVKMENLQLPTNALLPSTEQAKLIQPITHTHVAETGDVPAAFKRPPADQASFKQERLIGPGVIRIPPELETLTREEILAAYDAQMAQKRGEKPPPAPPAA